MRITTRLLASAEGCCAPTSAAQPGRYYDDPVAPKRIVLCPATRDAVTVDTSGALEILLGCQAVTDAPH